MFRHNDRSLIRHRAQSWAKVNKTRHLRPPGSSGQTLGLNSNYLERKSYKQFKRGNQKELVINFKLPEAVESRISSNLQTIELMAKSLNISISYTKLFNNQSKNLSLDEDGIEWCPSTGDDVIIIDDDDDNPNDVDDNTNDGNGNPNANNITCNINDNSPSEFCYEDTQGSVNYFKKPVSPKPQDFNDFMREEPGPSSAPDFIPVFSESESNNHDLEHETGDRLLALRAQTGYKYSYNDIITGTFEEKLDECLFKVVDVNTSNTDIQNLSMDFHEEFKAMVTKSEYQSKLKFRETLPTYKKSRDILHMITDNQVIVISGETGCGKSTQVPQIILDDAICNNKGANIKILVTQPRRIAASSLASRVAEERAETLGNSVGYAVRLEKVAARTRGSIMYCTTGVLLVELEANQGLTHYSHVILDEVHERDCDIDLSMFLLKKVLKQRKDLKLILMSATIDAEKLPEYFDNCPMMHIEGLAYPVQDIYLEDILQLTKYQLPPPWRKKQKNKVREKANLPMDKESRYKADIGPWLESIKHSLDSNVYQTLQDHRVEDIHIDLICKLLVHISGGPPGAVLVFLPGIGKIAKMIRVMTWSKMFPESKFEIYPLHSKLSTLDQHKIFERPPEGVRKIIIATNIAETSLTIDDIVYVVDCGRLNLSGLNVEENISTLHIEFISQTNLRQRRGRAGRCQPGVCYHLVTSHRASLLAERLLPELQRSDLLEPVLTIKRLRLGRAADALQEVPSPPAHSTVQWAVKHLQQCGALDEQETLTPLGWHLARLPVHPAAGKLLLLGALFGCLDRAASVAAVWGFKDPFQIVIDKEKEVDQVKRRFALGEPSDHVAISEAIIQWERQPHQTQEKFAVDHFLINSTLELLSDMKRQFGDSLRSMGFLASGDINSSWENRNVNNLSLFKAIVAASLYPKIATVTWVGMKMGKYNPHQHQKISVRTPEQVQPTVVHPSSVMAGLKEPLCARPGANWLVYWLRQRSTALYLFEVTLVYSLPLLFFGEFSVTGKISSAKLNLLMELRTLLDQVLASKVKAASDHSTRHSVFEQCVLNAVTELITAEDENTEYLDFKDLSQSDLTVSNYSQF